MNMHGIYQFTRMEIENNNLLVQNPYYGITGNN